MSRSYELYNIIAIIYVDDGWCLRMGVCVYSNVSHLAVRVNVNPVDVAAVLLVFVAEIFSLGCAIFVPDSFYLDGIYMACAEC